PPSTPLFPSPTLFRSCAADPSATATANRISRCSASVRVYDALTNALSFLTTSCFLDIAPPLPLRRDYRQDSPSVKETSPLGESRSEEHTSELQSRENL